jgi:VWFA-related protein
MRTWGVAVCFLALLASSGGPAGSQDVVPGVRTELVHLDVVVTDSQGKLVTDLTRDDFELLEDGKPQRISNFLVTGRKAPAAASPAPEGAGPPEGGAVDEEVSGPGRGIVIVVDDIHISRASVEFVKQALRRFVTDFLQEDDKAALVTTSRSSGARALSTDRAVLRQAIDGLSLQERAVAPARGSDMTPQQAEMILSGDSTALQLAARRMVTQPGSVLDGATPQAALQSPPDAASALAGVSSNKEAAAADEARRQARGVLNDALRFSSASLTTIETVLRSLAAFPGRKICLLVSDGFLVGTGTTEERRHDLQSIVDAATRSGAVVYSLDSRGLATSGADASVAGGSDAPGGSQFMVARKGDLLLRTTLEVVANDTGGFLISGTNDLAGGMLKMLQDNDGYYVMAYEPTNTKHDGRFRKIELRVLRRANLTVRTRKGYLAPDDKKRPTTVAANAPGLDVASARATLALPIPAGGIPVHLAADFLQVPAQGSEAVVRAQVDLSGLKWQEAQGRRKAKVELVGGVFDKDGNPIGPPFGRVAELDVAPGEVKRAAEAGLQYQQQLALPPGHYEVRLFARETQLGQLGGATQSVDIPDVSQNKLTMSGVFLSSAAPGAAGTGKSEKMRDVQAVRRFKQGASLYFQLYVYNARTDPSGARDVVLQAQIWSAGKAVAASKPQPAAFQQKDGVTLPETNGMPLEGLAPGDYELRVVVVDRKAPETIFRRVDFAVE